MQYSFAAGTWGILAFVALVWVLLQLPRLNLAIPHILLTGGQIEIASTPLPAGEQSVLEKLVLMGAAIVLTFVFRKIGRGGVGFIARKFHRTAYDYRKASSELAEVMATRLDMRELAQGIVERLAELMHLKRVGVMFFRGGRDCCCHEAQGFDGASWSQFCLSVENDMAAALQPFTGEVDIELLPHALRDEFHKAGFLFIVPIRSKEKFVGALLVGEKQSESRFRKEDLEFLSAVAKQASVALENAFLYEELAGQERMKHELELARKIQLDSLPQTTPVVEGLQMAGVSIPAFEVGGDYFDYLNGELGKITVIVGDVSGKGTSAALYMSKVQGILRSLHGFGLGPKEMFIRINELLYQNMERRYFVTALGGFFDTAARRLILARAGHLPLFMYRSRDGKVERIVPRGIGFGLDPERAFASELEEHVIAYARGDAFLFVTDGVTEAENPGGEQFGDERLVELLHGHAQESASDLRDRVLSAVKEFIGGSSQRDDQTVVAVKAV